MGEVLADAAARAVRLGRRRLHVRDAADVVERPVRPGHHRLDRLGRRRGPERAGGVGQHAVGLRVLAGSEQLGVPVAGRGHARPTSPRGVPPVGSRVDERDTLDDQLLVGGVDVERDDLRAPVVAVACTAGRTAWSSPSLRASSGGPSSAGSGGPRCTTRGRPPCSRTSSRARSGAASPVACFTTPLPIATAWAGRGRSTVGSRRRRLARSSAAAVRAGCRARRPGRRAGSTPARPGPGRSGPRASSHSSDRPRLICARQSSATVSEANAERGNSRSRSKKSSTRPASTTPWDSRRYGS